MSARRPLLTAIGAGTLLTALWFVPSANATTEHSGTAHAAAAGTSLRAQGEAAQPLALADTGGTDTTPYLVGGTICLGIGAGFVTFSVRQSRRC
ncbi:hypothetical protein LG634_33875 [Streptomyces bambusae]|uniref:hypothetical protein n=1 Tax=Streptomyces bambusae TaxID=1550616 RepID=UPI001CFFE8DE|nr:hypothetical protein [Streptomyces bambusae]MCB5169777.1 hypothetical protein [Streptomyces bambusae]